MSGARLADEDAASSRSRSNSRSTALSYSGPASSAGVARPSGPVPRGRAAGQRAGEAVDGLHLQPGGIERQAPALLPVLAAYGLAKLGILALELASPTQQL